MNACTGLAIADVTRWATRPILIASWRTRTIEAGLTTVAVVFVPATGDALVGLAALIVIAARIITASLRTEAIGADLSCAAGHILIAFAAALPLDTTLTVETMGIDGTPAHAFVLITAFAVRALTVLATTLAAGVFNANLSTITAFIIAAPTNAFIVLAKGALTTGHAIIVAAAAGLTIAPDTNRSHTAGFIRFALRTTKVVGATLTRRTIVGRTTIPTHAIAEKAEVNVRTS